MIPTQNRSAVAAPEVKGSAGLIPKSIFETKSALINDSGKPTRVPVPIKMSVLRNTERRTLPGVAPNAMRTPISLVRRDTV